MSSIWLRIDGYPATEIAAHTPPTWETEATGGCTSATWAFALSPRVQHPALKPQALVEIMCGPMRIWTGVLSEPNRSTWECRANGLGPELQGYLALDSGGAITRDVSVAINYAISNGWAGRNPLGFSGEATGDAADNPTSVAALLDQRAEDLGHRWRVNGRGHLKIAADPTTPRWLMSPDSAAFGVTDENAPRRLAARYNAGGGLYGTAFAGSGTPEVVVDDLLKRGPLTPLEAETALEGMLTRRGVTSWTNGVELHREQLTTMGGTPAALEVVSAGSLARAHGLAYNVGAQRPWLDVVIGKTRYTTGEDTIYLEPVNTAPRNPAAIIAAL